MHGARALYPAGVNALLARLRVVLCRPSHPGNIGAAARAMKTMGIADLRLVAPQRFPAPEAQWLATHALDVLDGARTHASLAEAIADCVAVFALSARPREWSPQVFALREAAPLALGRAASGPVAFVFGNESAGLTNEELFACQHLVHIPAQPQYGSLNLAQAVQVVCYELRLACGAGVPRARSERLATVADIEGLYAHLEQAALESGFLVPGSGSKLRERWRRLFSRVPMLEREEVNILRGLLRALQKDRGAER
jgi:tRNA/rRNA methyltransferase